MHDVSWVANALMMVSRWGAKLCRVRVECMVTAYK